MSDKINSPVFGETRHANYRELLSIALIVEETPMSVFQELNKKLNKLGFMITITSFDDIIDVI